MELELADIIDGSGLEAGGPPHASGRAVETAAGLLRQRRAENLKRNLAKAHREAMAAEAAAYTGAGPKGAKEYITSSGPGVLKRVPKGMELAVVPKGTAMAAEAAVGAKVVENLRSGPGVLKTGWGFGNKALRAGARNLKGTELAVYDPAVAALAQGVKGVAGKGIKGVLPMLGKVAGPLAIAATAYELYDLVDRNTRGVANEQRRELGDLGLELGGSLGGGALEAVEGQRAQSLRGAMGLLEGADRGAALLGLRAETGLAEVLASKRRGLEEVAVKDVPGPLEVAAMVRALTG